MLVKRSLAIAGHRTSLALEAEFWLALERASYGEGKSLVNLVGEIDKLRGAQAEKSGLASAVRVWLFKYYSCDYIMGETNEVFEPCASKRGMFYGELGKAS